MILIPLSLKRNIFILSLSKYWGLVSSGSTNQREGIKMILFRIWYSAPSPAPLQCLRIIFDWILWLFCVYIIPFNIFVFLPWTISGGKYNSEILILENDAKSVRTLGYNVNIRLPTVNWIQVWDLGLRNLMGRPVLKYCDTTSLEYRSGSEDCVTWRVRYSCSVKEC